MIQRKLIKDHRVKPPRSLYVVLDGCLIDKFMILGNRPFLEDGSIKQAVSASNSIEDALAKINDYEIKRHLEPL